MVMQHRVMQCLKTAAMTTLCLAPLSMSAQAANVNTVMQAENERTKAAQASQARINKAADQTNDALQVYKQEIKVIEDLTVYNKKLELQIAKQQERLDGIQKAITDVTVIQRQIMPLLIRMIDSLESFVDLDVPFQQTERKERVNFLRTNLDRTDLTIAEKFRQVLEAYKIENEYGRKVDHYTDTINIDGTDREVTLLQVGRIALLYQTTDGARSGAWDKEQGKFVALSNDEYQDAVQRGIRIAKKQASIDILTVPVPAARAMK